MNKSIYKYASEAGLPIGMYLTMMSACLLMSLRVEILSMMIFPLIVGFPIILGMIMKRISTQEPAYMKVSALWLGGIYTVIFGTLICSLFSGVYLVFVDPGFVNSYFDHAITTIETSPMAAEYESTTSLMREAMDAHILPTGMEFVSAMGWLTCFAGSILSLVLSVIIVRTGGKKRRLIMDN